MIPALPYDVYRALFAVYCEALPTDPSSRISRFLEPYFLSRCIVLGKGGGLAEIKEIRPIVSFNEKLSKHKGKTSRQLFCLDE
jgi:hypothetical protein